MKIWFIVLMSVLGVLIFGRSAATAQTQQQIQESQVQVSVERANVRDLPSLKGEVIFQVFRDDVLQVVQKEGGWYFVETFSGRRGYISNTVVRSVELRWRPVAPSLRASSTIFENSDVIAMVKAGLSDNIIIAAVRQSDLAEFDLSPAGLIALKESGVSEAVIQALINRGSQQSGSAVSQETPAVSENPEGKVENLPRPARPAAVKSNFRQNPREAWLYDVEATRKKRDRGLLIGVGGMGAGILIVLASSSSVGGTIFGGLMAAGSAGYGGWTYTRAKNRLEDLERDGQIKGYVSLIPVPSGGVQLAMTFSF